MTDSYSSFFPSFQRFYSLYFIIFNGFSTQTSMTSIEFSLLSRYDVISWKNSAFLSSIWGTLEPSILTPLSHHVNSSLSKLQLVGFLRLVRIQGNVGRGQGGTHQIGRHNLWCRLIVTRVVAAPSVPLVSYVLINAPSRLIEKIFKIEIVVLKKGVLDIFACEK